MDYAFIRYFDNSNRWEIRVLENDSGNWSFDTTLTYQGPGVDSYFGNFLENDDTRLIASRSFNGTGDVSIYKIDSTGITLEQVIGTKPWYGMDIHGDRLVVSGDDTTFIYEREMGTWEFKNFLFSENYVALWENRLVRHNYFEDEFEIWHKIGNVCGLYYSDSIDLFNAHDIYGQFYAVATNSELSVYSYENGTYQQMTLPSNAQDFGWNDVDLYGDYMIVITGDGGGLARVFKYSGSAWEHIQDITDPFNAALFGGPVSSDGVNYILGIPSANVNCVFGAGKILLGPLSQ